MSQFMLIVGNRPKLYGIPGLEVHHIAKADAFLERASRDLVSPSDLRACWYIEDKASMSVDTLFTEAQKELAVGAQFDTTRLGKLLSQLLITSKEIILWYGDEWMDLPCTSDETEFIALTESQIAEDSGEVYLRFCGAK